MKKKYSIILIVFILISCNNLNNDEVKKKLDKKIYNILQCNSNSDILNINVSDLNIENNNYIEFSGSYKAKLGLKYDGTFEGHAILSNDSLQIKLLNYKNSISSGIVSNSCLE